MTEINSVLQGYDSNGVAVYTKTIFGLSSETKPTDPSVGNASAFVEFDASKVCFYDYDGQQWLEWGADASAATLSASFAASPVFAPAVQPISLDRPGTVFSPSVIENAEISDEEPAEEADLPDEPEDEVEDEQESIDAEE